MSVVSDIDYSTSHMKVIRENWIFILILVFYSVSPYLYILRVVLPDSPITWVALRLLQPLTIIALLFSLLFMRNVKLDLYSLMCLPLLVYGILSAIMWQNEPFKIVTGSSHFIFGLLVYIYFRNNKKISGPIFEKFLFVLSIISLASLTAVISVMVSSELIFGISIYLGLACQILIIAFYIFVYQNRYFLAILTVGVIVLSGKRGVLVALLLSMMAYSIPNLVIHRLREVLIVTCFGAIVLITAGIYNSEYLENIGEKFSFEETKSVNDFSSGRLNEALSAIDFFTDDKIRIFTGAGFGFTYIYRQENQQLADVEDYGNVHFSPLNPLIIFGSIISIIYFVILFLLIGKTLLSSNNGLRWPLKSALVGSLIYTAFVFNLFNEPFLWALLGFLNRDELEYH